MSWNIIDFLRLSLITIITMACIHAFLHKNKSIDKSTKTKFIILSCLLMLEGIEAYVDQILCQMTNNSLNTLRVAASVVGYTLRPAMMYIVLLIMLREVKFRFKKLILAIPTILTFLISIMAFFTKLVFYYDENNWFHGGPLRYVLFALLFVYFVVILTVNLINWKKNRAEGKVIFAVIGLLLIDWILALIFDIIDLHEVMVSLSILLYFMYFLTNLHNEKMREKEQELAEQEHLLVKTMLDQSIETLAYTIDAKDKYTKGHSFRVAKYSRMIAGMDGQSEEECRQIYLAGLLHDIGKISISDSIINKIGDLTDEEYERMKSHPEKGALILEKMKSIPYLRDGAKYHHERYDGTGYPCGLKGDEIPKMARIIAVADAYDTMTSYRCYRNPMDQNYAKQEIWKGIETQFDPHYAKIMISLIDADYNYEMKEIPNKQDELIFDDNAMKAVWPTQEPANNNLSKKKRPIQQGFNTMASQIMRDDNWTDVISGELVSQEPTVINYTGITKADAPYIWCAPVLLVYSSDDGTVLGPNYVEFAVYMTAGYGWKSTPAISGHSKFKREADFISWEHWLARNKEGLVHTLTVKMEDNTILVRNENGLLTMEAYAVVPKEYKQKLRIAFSGIQCEITDIKKTH